MDGRKLHLYTRESVRERAGAGRSAPSLLDVITALRDAEHALVRYLDSIDGRARPEDQAFFARQLQQVRRMQVLTCKSAALKDGPCERVKDLRSGNAACA